MAELGISIGVNPKERV